MSNYQKDRASTEGTSIQGYNSQHPRKQTLENKQHFSTEIMGRDREEEVLRTRGDSQDRIQTDNQEKTSER